MKPLRNSCLNHDPLPVVALVASFPVEPDGSGWLYAAVSESGILKVGGTSRCPWCRNQTSSVPLAVVGIRYSSCWMVDEVKVLAALGRPVRGREWFDEASGRLAFLFESGMMIEVDRLNRELVAEYG